TCIFSTPPSAHRPCTDLLFAACTQFEDTEYGRVKADFKIPRQTLRTYRSIHDREREAELQLWKELYRNWQVTGLILPVDVLERRLTSTIPRPLSRTVSEDDVRRDNIDDRSVGAVAVKPPRLRRAAMRHWGLTARRARANPTTVPPMRLRC